MAEVRRETFAGGRETLDSLKGALCKGQPTGEVGVGGQGRGKPVSQPSDFVFEVEVEVVESDACRGGGGALLGGVPVNELSLGNREGQAFGGRNAAKGTVVTLKELDVSPVRGRRYCNHKVIDLGEDQALGNGRMERGNVNNKQQRRDGGALRGTHGDRREFFGEP